MSREKNFNLLDIGCGNGSFLGFLRSKNVNASLYGIDLVYNENHNGIEFIRGDFLNTEINQKFEFVTCLSTIEHIENPVRFMDKIRSAMAVNGNLIITSVNSLSLLYKTARILSRVKIINPLKILHKPHHINHYSKKSLELLLKQNQMKIISRKTINWPLSSTDVVTGTNRINNLYYPGLPLINMLSTIISSEAYQIIIARKQ